MAVKKEIPVDVIEKAKKALANTPAKPATAKLLADALEDLKPVILDLEKKGYSRTEIKGLLGNQGIAVKDYSLKALLGVKRAEKAE